MARPLARRAGAGPPEWIPPQLTQLADAAPDGPDWLHEIKFDGYRMHARLDRGAVKLLTRTGLDWTHKYPPIAAAVSALGARQERLAWIQHWLGAGLQAIETLLAEHPASGRFCHGESPTVADICLVTQVTPAMTFNLSLDPYPRVMRVYNTCMAIPAFADAHPSKQPDAE